MNGKQPPLRGWEVDTMNGTDLNKLANGQWLLWWGVRRSIRYHDRRIVWFDFVQRMGRFLTLVTGGATAASILKECSGHWSVGFALACSVFSALDLAFDVSAKARLHCSLKVKFIDLEREINLIGYDRLNEDQLLRFNARRSEIERDEPPVLRCLDMICDNELRRADGIEGRHKVYWWQRLLKNVWYGDPPDHEPLPA